MVNKIQNFDKASQKDLQKFLKDCANVVSKVIKQQHLSFYKQETLVDGKIRYVLKGNEISKAEAKYTYVVVPFIKKEYKKLWLAIELVFDSKLSKSICPINVEILVFQGEQFDFVKSVLFRAEWEFPDKSNKIKHAQPHWHVYPGNLYRPENSEIGDFKTKTDVITFKPENMIINEAINYSELENVSKFHFAMASRWHLGGKNMHQEDLDEQKVIKWLGGCLDYISLQLLYIFNIKVN
jgi:hypothetical protein